jgi:alpha-galactosidase
MPIYPSNNTWVLETRSTAYAFGLNNQGVLTHQYWGPRLANRGEYSTPSTRMPLPFALPEPGPDAPPLPPFLDPLKFEEYPGYGGARYTDPCLKLNFADGVRDVVLTYVGFSVHDSAAPELVIHLKDAHYPLKLDLHYRLHEAYDLIERWVTLENTGETPIQIERAFSAMWNLPEGVGYFLTHLNGNWIDEFHLNREELHPGLKIIDSRRIITSHQASPWFAIDRGFASEESGDVWFGALAWSGNWKLSAEVTEFSVTRLSMGLNDWDFGWTLTPGGSFTTPPAFAGFTQHGFGAASRLLHDYTRDCVLPHGNSLHKVLYNSWEATLFNVDEPSQAALAEIAARIGVELFVMDDGWFHKRRLDNAGLGDWWPDEVKFPNGLGGLIQKVNDLGMEFGLWIEPEMVNPDSELYRAHPDWVLHFPTRARTEMRNQLILNMARTDVQDYIIQMIDRLLSENAIAFIKWDMNRSASEPGWEGAPGDPREVWVRYVEGVYRVWGTLRERHPQVIWQSCASGGGRADLGILRLADQVWVSDNSEPVARLAIQEGYSLMLPANTMEAWVTDAGMVPLPLEFRFHVSMCGSLGIGANLNHWGEAEITLAKQCVQTYKEIRPTVQFGDQYRLISPQKHAFSAVEYVSKDKAEAVLFVFRVMLTDPAKTPVLYLRGLDPDALYQMDGIAQPRSGSAWMEAGVKVGLMNLKSKLVRFKRVG